MALCVLKLDCRTLLQFTCDQRLCNHRTLLAQGSLSPRDNVHFLKEIFHELKLVAPRRGADQYVIQDWEEQDNAIVDELSPLRFGERVIVSFGLPRR